MKKGKFGILIIIVFSFLFTLYFYPQLPEKMASHWNFKGEVDGYMSKFWGAFLMPFISIGLFLLYLVIPKIDPLRENIEKFREYFDGLIALIIGFLFYLHILVIVWNIGINFNLSQFIIPALGVLFYYIGILVDKAKRNWFIGIRTPWTLSSEKVWNKTHKIGGKLFKIAGIVAFFGILFPTYAMFFVLIPVLFVTGYLIVYSYLEYRKEEF